MLLNISTIHWRIHFFHYLNFPLKMTSRKTKSRVVSQLHKTKLLRSWHSELHQLQTQPLTDGIRRRALWRRAGATSSTAHSRRSPYSRKLTDAGIRRTRRCEWWALWFWQSTHSEPQHCYLQSWHAHSLLPKCDVNTKTTFRRHTLFCKAHSLCCPSTQSFFKK